MSATYYPPADATREEVRKFRGDPPANGQGWARAPVKRCALCGRTKHVTRAPNAFRVRYSAKYKDVYPADTLICDAHHTEAVRP